MNKYDKFVGLFGKFYDENDIKIDEKLSSYVNFKVGGPADILLIPKSKEQVIKSVEVCKENKIPFYLIGNGSNILVRDGGFRGVVISLKEVNTIIVDGDKIEAECGAMLKAVSDKAMENSLTGFEFACGIPGTIGGAVFMNAGAYDGEMSHVVTAVRAVDFQGNIKEYDASHLDFAYRHSVFHDNHEVIGEVIMTLKPGDKDAIKARMDELTEKRESKQPLEYASAGSTFKRPPGYFAGTLIEQTGLKGLSVGDAQVSHKHAGFVINTGSASAKDVLDLISEVQRRVYDQHGVHLEPEVRMIGED